MPLYEYTCPNCNGKTEVIVPKVSDKKKKAPGCPKCKRKMTPVDTSSVAPFRWGKGGGWN